MPTLTFRIKKRPDASALLVPTEAILAEVAAGELSRQAMMWQWSTAADYVWALETTMRTSRPDYSVPEISEDAFEGMRVELLRLRQRWNELPTGETLELAFPGVR